jgi:hypothetical protein
MPQLLDKLVELRLIQPLVPDGMPSHCKPKSRDLPDIPKALSREELVDVLLSPFVENERSCIAYARNRSGMGLSEWDIVKLKGEVAVRCLPISSKVSLHRPSIV